MPFFDTALVSVFLVVLHATAAAASLFVKKTDSSVSCTLLAMVPPTVQSPWMKLLPATSRFLISASPLPSSTKPLADVTLLPCSLVKSTSPA